jgi:hypothetical protein
VSLLTSDAGDNADHAVKAEASMASSYPRLRQGKRSMQVRAMRKQLQRLPSICCLMPGGNKTGEVMLAAASWCSHLLTLLSRDRQPVFAWLGNGHEKAGSFSHSHSSPLRGDFWMTSKTNFPFVRFMTCGSTSYSQRAWILMR